MLTTSITARLAGCAAVAALALGIGATHLRATDAAPDTNIVALRTIQNAASAGSQVAYRDVNGRIVIDAISGTGTRTAAIAGEMSAIN